MFYKTLGCKMMHVTCTAALHVTFRDKEIPECTAPNFHLLMIKMTYLRGFIWMLPYITAEYVLKRKYKVRIHMNTFTAYISNVFSPF